MKKDKHGRHDEQNFTEEQFPNDELGLNYTNNEMQNEPEQMEEKVEMEVGQVGPG